MTVLRLRGSPLLEDGNVETKVAAGKNGGFGGFLRRAWAFLREILPFGRMSLHPQKMVKLVVPGQRFEG